MPKEETKKTWNPYRYSRRLAGEKPLEYREDENVDEKGYVDEMEEKLLLEKEVIAKLEKDVDLYQRQNRFSNEKVDALSKQLNEADAKLKEYSRGKVNIFDPHVRVILDQMTKHIVELTAKLNELTTLGSSIKTSSMPLEDCRNFVSELLDGLRDGNEDVESLIQKLEGIYV